jgi:hypothetical protein
LRRFIGGVCEVLDVLAGNKSVLDKADEFLLCVDGDINLDILLFGLPDEVLLKLEVDTVEVFVHSQNFSRNSQVILGCLGRLLYLLLLVLLVVFNLVVKRNFERIS